MPPEVEMKKIPLIDLGRQNAALRPQFDEAIASVIDRSAFIQGPEVRRFEADFAAFADADAAVGVASGTAALILSLQACGIGAGDEVITTPATFIATAEAISAVGATPVFADIDPNTGNLDPAKAAETITSRTKAILPVHLYGRPADMPAFRRLADDHGLFLIEDAAQAHGASLDGASCGSMGDLACFSFYPGKNLGAFGDAGAVTGAAGDLIERVRMLRDHGRTTKYEHQLVGLGERMDTLQAAVLNVKLPHLREWTNLRRAWADRYRERLGDLMHFIEDPAGAHSCYHLMVGRVANRDELLAQLQNQGIGAGIHYPIPLHMQPAYAHLGHTEGDFPEAERLAREAISLPLFPEMTDQEFSSIVTAVQRAAA